MIKTTLISRSTDGLENIEAGRLKTYLSEKGYKTNHAHFSGGMDVDNQCCYCLDFSGKLYVMSVYSESSVYPDDILFFSQLGDKIKSENPNSIVVLSGKYASIYYKEILKDKRFSHIDYIILGDCEYTLSSLIDCINKNDDISKFVAEHKNIVSKESTDNKEFLNIDINELPLPDRFFIKNSKNFYNNYYAFICDSHGCCMRCAYCTRGQFYKKWTGRSAESIFNEIKTIRNESSIKCFWLIGGSFEDPGGELGIKKIKDFCNLIFESNLKVSLRCYLRSNFISKVDTDLFKLMKKAGFHAVLIGVESGNEYDLKLYNKATTIEKNRLALKKLNEAGIYSDHYGFIMINPYSTPERLRANFLFLEEHQPHDLDNYVHHLVADPGTMSRKKIEEDGLLIPTDDFLKQGHSYRFLHPFAAEVSTFLRKYFLIFDTETAGISTFIFHLAPFLPHGKTFEEDVTSIMNRRSRVFSDYFRILYMDMNIGLCEKRYDEFMSTLKNFDKELDILKNKLIRDLIKFKIM
ncbi:MAG: radical SAM protein [Oscillospiraceae bacterium]|nr:radical SAM protein [Oscillospiraceae bacterium]